VATVASELVEIPLDQLVFGDDFRIDDDPEALAEMVESIRALGVLSPLLVRTGPGGYEVVAGRRRLAAARHAGLSTVPCLVRDYDDDQAVDVTIAENLHRRHLSPVEEAMAYGRLRDTQGLTQVEIAERVGRSQPHVGRMLWILTLPASQRERIHKGNLRYTTLWDHKDRTRTGRRRGSDKRGPQPHDDSELVHHWRRRHDRLVEGIRAVLAAGREPAVLRPMLERLLKVDLTPLDPIVESDAPNGGRRGSAPKATPPPSTKRTCANPACDTQLSTGNPGDLCSRCERVRRERPAAFAKEMAS
jgi:ParB/RepB/Spo0J family partition protein